MQSPGWDIPLDLQEVDNLAMIQLVAHLFVQKKQVLPGGQFAFTIIKTLKQMFWRQVVLCRLTLSMCATR